MKEPKLPPAGFKRDEELKKRTDALEQQGETTFKEAEVEKIDPTKFDEVDNEIAQHFDPTDFTIHISNKDPAYEYCWVQCKSPATSPGQMVKYKLALRGWEVVHGDMSEAKELKAADGTRVLGDTLLMRCRKDHYKAFQKQEAAKRKAQQEGVENVLEGMEQKYQGLGVKFHKPGEMPEHIQKRMQSRSQYYQNQGQFDRMIREGNIPGVPVAKGR